MKRALSGRCYPIYLRTAFGGEPPRLRQLSASSDAPPTEQRSQLTESQHCVQLVGSVRLPEADIYITGKMNGHSTEALHGIYVPVLTFFDDTKEQNVDHATLEKHIHMCLAGGSQGVVCLGSTGERVCLSEQEQDEVIRSARKAVDSFGDSSRVLIAGAGGHSTTDAIKRVNAAAAAGAVGPPLFGRV